MVDPAPIHLDADPLWIGFDWEIPVTLTDDTTGEPIDISTWTIGGDLWLPYQPAAMPTELTVVDQDDATASWTYEVPRALTATIRLEGVAPGFYPCRIMAWYVDGAQKKHALRPIFIQPLDPRTSKP